MTSTYGTVSFDHERLIETVSRVGQMERYLELLRVENRKINLVSRETIDEGLAIVAAESLLPLEHLPRESFDRYLDIGSGGGLPAIPILLTGKARQAALLERASKKYLALRRILRGLGEMPTPVDLLESTLEEFSPDAPFDLVTMRLVKPTDKIMRKVRDILSDDGFFVYYSQPPREIDIATVKALTLAYQTGNESPRKYFTIFQKKL